MNKIKVFHLIGNLSLGGTQNVVLNILKTTNTNKFDLYFGVFENSNIQLADEIIKLKGKIVYLPEINRNYFAYYNNLKEIFKSNGGYHIFHSHMHLNNGIALMASKHSDVPVSVSHSHSIKRVSRNKLSISNKIYEIIMRRFIREAADVYLASSKDAGIYMYGESFFLNKGIIFKNGIDIDKYQFSLIKREKLRKDLGLNEKLVLGNVGTLSKVKNQQFIVDITQELLQRGIDVVAIIIGEGSERKNLEKKIADLEIEQNVLLFGSKNEVVDYYNAMDVYVFPSLHEGLGITCIEAQSNGLPVLISDGVPKEVKIKNNVRQLKLSDSLEKWGDCVIELYDKRSNYRNEELILKGYSNQDMGKIMEKIYLDALHGSVN